MSETVMVALVGAASAIIGAIVAAYVTIKRLPADTRRVDAETMHVAVDVAGDALEQIQKAANERTEALTAIVQHLGLRVKELEERDKKNNEMIILLNRKLGEMMRTAEAQSRELTRLEALTETLQEHIAELVLIIKNSGLTDKLPEWAMAVNGRVGR